MFKPYRLWILSLLLLSLPGFAAEPRRAKWTVMVYLAGDNDLEAYVVKDLENELARIGSTDQVQIVALADRIPGDDASRGDWTGTRLFHVTRGMPASPEAAMADWGERNTGDPKTLLEFVSWSKANYPAERYALYLWGHGWNWHPGYIMEDQTSQDALDPAELRAILPQLGWLDLVAYDGCNMGSIEVEAMWYGQAAALVHSQEFVDWDGLEYDLILEQLNHNPGMSAQQLAIVSNQSASGNQERTGSAVMLDQRFNALLGAVDTWSLALMAGYPQYRDRIESALHNSQAFLEAPDELDLYDLASRLQTIPDREIQASSRTVMAAIKSSVVDEWHRQDYPGVHGITISKPRRQDPNWADYQRLDFARLTHWDEFLELRVD